MSKREILIVDDEMDICYLLKGILRKRNLDSAIANSLNDAQRMIDREPPDLLILDNRLPDGMGVDFIPYVKENYPNVKILMVSAFDSTNDKKLAYNKGADMFLGKPLNKDIINSALSKLI